MLEFEAICKDAKEIMQRNNILCDNIKFINEDDIIKSMNDAITHIKKYNNYSVDDINRIYSTEKNINIDLLLSKYYRQGEIERCQNIIKKATALHSHRNSDNLNQMVDTNIGSMPIEDYREIMAIQYGFDSYEDMYEQGFRLGDGYDIKPKPEKEMIPETKSDINYAISKYTISPLSEPKNGIVAVVSATFYNTLTVNSITIRQGLNNNLYVKMPQKLTQHGNYIDVVHPLNTEGRKNINTTILNAYKSGNLNQKFSVPSEPKITAQNSVKYPEGKYGNNLARLDILVNDMVVHNCKIINGKNDQPFLSMPTYKDKNGEFHSIITPSSSEAFKAMSTEAMKEYNTEYKFAKCDNNELSALKESGVKFTANTDNHGNNFVKFKADDADKVNQVLNNNFNSAVKK